MRQIDLSVIVTCYNLQDYLGDCLKSIARTNFPKDNFEVLMVDDGSTDLTPEIVDRYARKYPQFRALHKKNDGVSQARNYGMDRARGKYIAFVDGDDIVPPDAYPDLMYTAEVHRSQVVVGFVKRFDNLRCHGSYLHKFAVKDNLINTTLAQTHSLLYDTTTWNKVYRRDFLQLNHIRFIPHIIYEDLPFTLTVHLRSRRTSTIKNVVYYWRWRASSITQSRKALDNFKSRIKALDICRNKLLEAGFKPSSSLFKDFKKKVLGLDLHIFLENIGDAEGSYIYRVQEIIYRFMRNWHLWASPYLSRLPIKDQISYCAVKTGNFNLLKEFTYVKNKEVGGFQRFHLRHYRYRIPGVSDDMMRHLNVRDNTVPLTQKLKRLNLDPQRHLCSGSGMFRMLHIRLIKRKFKTDNVNEHLTAKLVNLNNHRGFPIVFRRYRTAIYKRVFRPATNWTNARYYFRFNYVRAARKLGAGRWVIRVKDVVDRRYWVAAVLGRPMKARRDLFQSIDVGQLALSNGFNTNWQLIFRARPLREAAVENLNQIAGARITDGHLDFRARLAAAADLVPVIKFSDRNWLRGEVVTRGRINWIRFSLERWPRKDLQRTYALRLIHRRTNKEVPYLFKTVAEPQLKTVNRQMRVLVAYNRRRSIRVALQCRQFVMRSWRLVDHRRVLRIVTRFGMPERLTERQWHFNHLRIEMVSHSLRHRYLLTVKRNRIRFRGRDMIFDVPLLSGTAKQLRVLSGNYKFVIYLPTGPSQVIKTGIVLKNDLTMSKARPLPIRTRDRVTYQITRNLNGGLKLSIRQPWTGFDRSKTHRALAYTLLYPLMRLLPLRNVMCFDSYWSSQFSSNERAIYEYVRAHYPKIRTVWFFHNRQTWINGNGKRVKTHSWRYWYYLATAKYLIQNTNLPNQYYKRPGQIEVETLHGTFLKHMGFDEPHFRNASRRIQDNFARRIRRWDYMVVPSDYMKQVASRAFDYHQRVIPAGFPRNDELAFHNNRNYIATIKRKLNIPLNKKVILYAPTYRKGQKFHFPLDLDQLEKHLAPNYVLLVRLHYFVAHSGDFFSQPGFVYDVSDYPNINDLYLISDVLVTDYSSVMFDYAYLKRPMIFYAYDQDWYLDNRHRGIYLDYDRDMPGPVVRNQADLTRELLRLDQIKTKYHDQLLRFSRRFAQYGRHGDATKRVVETVLGTRRSQLDQVPDRHVIFNKFWHWFRIKDLQSALLNYLGRVLPKRNIIMFESFFGTQYSDNPKAIYLYIRKHDPQYKCYWNVNAEDVPYFKHHHIPYITRFGYRGIFKQAQARYWITNTRRPFRWNVPRRTTLLQTWHGTPLKTIGADVSLVTMPGNNTIKYHRQVYNDNRRWDYLLAPNLYSARIMRRCFRMGTNQMMLTGYPRNDLLVNATQQTADRIKRRLHIDPHKKVILYAPTWRDDEFVKSDEFIARLHLDLSQFQRHYGNRVVVLVRTHYMIANHLDLSRYRNIAINVSDYPDIAELYLISDVLITDYSSVMFDYAILKRPMIFFDYDFKNYAKNTRGFYFDFRKVAPGPIVTTTRQVIQQLDPILAGHWRMNANYRRFVKRFTPWMDGRASARVVHQLFSGRHFKNCDLTRRQLHLPRNVHVRDGAAMWMPDKDFRLRYGNNFYRNYDNDGQQFRVVKGRQLQSLGFGIRFGMQFVLLENPKSADRVWVSRDDVTQNS